MHWKATDYIFYDELGACKCGHYWLSKSITSFINLVCDCQVQVNLKMSSP